jgi:surface antigen
MKIVSIAYYIGFASLFLSGNAENICNETPPADRAIDGIPAYAQCSTSTDASVYSNNGVDTRTSSGGSGWVRTQYGGGYQCTEFAHRYLSFKYNVKSVPDGNAGTWGDKTLPAGLVKTTVPVHGDLIIFAPGSCGAGATTGHVAVVDIVKDSTLTIVEQNGASRRKCKASCARWFLHAQANTGIIAGSALPVRSVADNDIAVRSAGGVVEIVLPGDFASGATAGVYDLRGRLIADLTGRITGGTASFTSPRAACGTLVVAAAKGGRTAVRKILSAK